MGRSRPSKIRDSARVQIKLATTTENIVKHWQGVIKHWVINTLGPASFQSTKERQARFLEECLELVQVTGMSKDAAHRLVDYVYNRPVGILHQEIGGVFVSFLALVENQGEVALDCLINESKRIHDPSLREKIQARGKEKIEQGVGI